MKKIYSLIIGIVLLLTNTSTAQSWQWGVSGGSNAFGQDSRIDETIRSIQVDGNGNIYTYSYIGGTDAIINGVPRQTYNWNNDYEKTDALICSYDCNGVYRWSKVLGGGFDDQIQNMGIDAEGNVYVSVLFTGAWSEYPVSQIHLDEDALLPMSPLFTNTYKQTLFLVKYNSAGVLQWYKSLQPANVSYPENYTQYSPLDLVVDPDGTCYWFNTLRTGVFANGAYTVNNTSNTFTYHVLKYDSAGNFIGGHPMDFHLNIIGVNDDLSTKFKFKRNHTNGNYYIVGQVEYADNELILNVGGQNYTQNDIGKYVVAFDASGNFLWIRHNNNVFGTSSTLFDITFDTDNNIYYTGAGSAVQGDNFTPESWNGQQFIATLPNNGVNYFRILVKMNENGDTVWQTNANTSNTYTAGEKSVAVYNDQVILGGGAHNFQWQTITNIDPNGVNASNSSRAGIIRFNKNTGTIIDANFVSNGPGTSSQFNRVCVDTKGNIYGGGQFPSSVTVNGTSLYNYGGPNDFLIAKFGTNNCDFLGTEAQEQDKTGFFPNPVQEELSIANNEPLTYEIYTSLGNLIQSGVISVGGKVSFENLAKGIYLLQTKNEKGVIKTEKIVKE